MKPIIKAKETEYRGYPFRSRLEARWAYFLDCVGEPWEYEKQDYELPSARYLPDFWIPRQKVWLEIKGVEPSETERRKCEELTEMTGSECVLAWGEPFAGFDGRGSLEIYKRHGEWRRAALATYGYWLDFVEEGIQLDRYHKLLTEDQIEKTRGVRFEHGQKPKVRQIVRTNARWRLVRSQNTYDVRLVDVIPWLANQALKVRNGNDYKLERPFCLNDRYYLATIDSACRHIRITLGKDGESLASFTSDYGDDPYLLEPSIDDLELPEPDSHEWDTYQKWYEELAKRGQA